MAFWDVKPALRTDWCSPPQFTCNDFGKMGPLKIWL